tara:strand:- start:96 stop:227 length:132 start_codon:yes stop_codon:yes gene_type:complete
MSLGESFVLIITDILDFEGSPGGITRINEIILHFEISDGLDIR